MGRAGVGRKAAPFGSSPFRRPSPPYLTSSSWVVQRSGPEPAECAATACVLCVCCPLALLWCFVKLPCQIVWRATRRAADSIAAASCSREGACCWSPGRRRALLEVSSSFSDREFDGASRPQLRLTPLVTTGATKKAKSLPRSRCLSMQQMR